MLLRLLACKALPATTTIAILLLTTSHLAGAQVTTKCNPLSRSDCPGDAALGGTTEWDFSRPPPSELWETTAGTVRYDATTGAALTVAKQGDSPTLRSRFYFLFGRTEMWVRAAPGRGIVSSMMWLSDALDEVDWEFMGANASYATTNYFAKGRQDFGNGGVHPMVGMQDALHNYTTLWTRDRLDWFIDGARVRSLRAEDANGTDGYPQTPMRMSIGIWAGGDPSLPEGTRLWAGGDTDYASGPYTMYLKTVKVTDFGSGREYTYGDRSGTWQSIRQEAGESAAASFAAASHDHDDDDYAAHGKASRAWHGLSRTGKIAVGSCVGGVGGLVVIALIVFCLRQRSRGAKEARRAEQRDAVARADMEERGGHRSLDEAGGALAMARHKEERQQSSSSSSSSSSPSSSSHRAVPAAAAAAAADDDADSIHAPETTVASPLAAGDGSWSGSVAGTPTIIAAAAVAAAAVAASADTASADADADADARQSPRVDSPAPSSRLGRDANNALGFDFGVAAASRSPGRPQPPPNTRAGSPLAGSPLAGTPRAGSPRAGAPLAGTPFAGTPLAGTPRAIAAAAAAFTRPSTPMSRAASPGLPPDEPLPSPRIHTTVSRIGSPVFGLPSPLGISTPADDGQHGRH